MTSTPAPETPRYGERRMSYLMQPCGRDGQPLNGGRHYANAHTLEDARDYANRVLTSGDVMGLPVHSVRISGGMYEFRGDAWRELIGADDNHFAETVTLDDLGGVDSVDSITVEPMTQVLRQLAGRETDPNHLAVVHRTAVGYFQAVLHTTDDVHQAYAYGRVQAPRLGATVLTRSTYAPTVVGADVAARVSVDPLTQPIVTTNPHALHTGARNHCPDDRCRAAHGTCGSPWVAEIELCPRCGHGAEAHPIRSS